LLQKPDFVLKQASVQQVRNQELPRENSLIVICMCFYPRGIKKEWRDDYKKELAPDRELFQEWKKLEKTDGHEGAFRLSHYEERFDLSELALRYLKYYCDESLTQDVYLVCQCKVGEKCHREMLMLIAQKKFGTPIDKIFNDYSVFVSRLTDRPTKI
jgi:uncharacterized protein YeaO (DUF488 family)